MTVISAEEKIEDRFASLRDKWKAESKYLSNTAQMALLWPYQQVIGMGADALPMILIELQREPDHCFWALEAITGENPVPEESAGDVEQSAKAWIDWGKQRQLIPS